MTEVQLETRRRKRERLIVALVSGLLLIFTGIEVQLLKVSSKLPIVNSVFFFGLMNINIVLIMVLLFLVFRNAVKMILDQRRGRIGSRLRTRLVVCFVLFAIIPTLLLFTISAFYIRSSFDKWFNLRVKSTLGKGIEVVETYYETTKRTGSHFAKKIAVEFEGDSKKDTAKKDPAKKDLALSLEHWRAEYGLDGVEFFSSPLSERVVVMNRERVEALPAPSLETLQKVFEGDTGCRVNHVGQGELVRCGIRLSGNRGAIFADTFIPLGLASRLSEITLTYEDFRTGNPLNYPIKSTYFLMLSMMTLLILFSAVWTGFYVARRLTVPIEELSRGTDALAHGNLNYRIPTFGQDEMGKLIDSFNRMTADLKQNKEQIETAHTHLQAVNEELKHRRRYIEVLLESIQSGVVSLDENGRISMVNPAATALLAGPSTELVGRPYWAVIPEKHRAEVRELLYTVYGSSRPVRREMSVRTPQGDLITLLVTVSVLRDERKKQLGVVAVLDDVSEIQRMERMAAWREVAKRIAHEIKNPLTPIQLSIQRLRRRYLGKIQDDGTFDEATSIVLNEVDALKSLVSEFSAFARMPDTLQKPDDLNATVLDAVNLFRSAHENIQFDLELSDSVPTMAMDKNQIKRVLINLFDNAVSAMEGQGRIAVATECVTRQPGAAVRISISDNGCGLPQEVQERLFEPYFSTKQDGTGLGLAIVQRIVSDHGGSIRASANHPKGTKFVIELPQTLTQGSTEKSNVRTYEEGRV